MGGVVEGHVAPCEMYRWVKCGDRRYGDLARAKETKETHGGGSPHHQGVMGDRTLFPLLLHGGQRREHDGETHPGGVCGVSRPHSSNASQK